MESARREWEAGYRRFLDEARDPALGELLHRRLALATEELRRRVGGTYTLAELAAAYPEVERWARATIEERTSAAVLPRTLALVGDAAFHLYSRGAVDYVP